MFEVTEFLLQMPRNTKRSLVFLLDLSVCVFSVWFAFYLRLGQWGPISEAWFGAFFLAVLLSTLIFIVSGLYRMIFRYIGWSSLLTIIKSVLVYAFFYSTIITVVGIDGIPRTIGIIQPLLLMVGMIASRTLAQFWLGGIYRSITLAKSKPTVLIYGAGSTGRQLAKAIELGGQMRVAGFIDDDQTLQKSKLDGKVIYSPDDLEVKVNLLNVSDVLLAIPSASRKRRNEILKLIAKSKVSVRNLPSLTDLADGKVVVSDLRDLDVDDLLGRSSISPDLLLMSKNISEQKILVTGAGGSIGSELCKKILVWCPSLLILVEQNEHALYEVQQELEHLLDTLDSASKIPKIVAFIGSVQDQNRMEQIFREFSPDVIFHSAAYKHVPLVESNPFEAVKNNIFGTQILAKVATKYNAKKFLLISTDKAVRPTNIMGCTKRVAELIVQSFASTHYGMNTCFSMVRFGNVLDSSGSVVPKFRKQIKSGGPITITHKDVTRYFMTIPEAAELVIQAGAMAEGGEVFVLDMGEAVKIIDLATQMILLSGLSLRTQNNPDGDIEIQFIGLRPGEKLYEELLIGNNPCSTSHVKIMKANEQFLELNLLEKKLDELIEIVNDGQISQLKEIFISMNIEYSPEK